MKNLKDTIIEKLVIKKDSILKKPDHNEQVLILDIYNGNMNCSYDLKLFVTGLENIRNKHNIKDVLISKQKRSYQSTDPNYIFDCSNHNNKITWEYHTDKKYKMSNLLLYPQRSNNNQINENILDKFIDDLNDQIKNKENKYIRIQFADDTNHYFRYLYLWYSQSLDAVWIYLSNEEYKNLLNQGKFDE